MIGIEIAPRLQDFKMHPRWAFVERKPVAPEFVLPRG
jgi:hypothetical protein